jgi:hypothetical protein
VLADLLDLRGSVTLAEALTDLDPPADALYDASGAAALLADVRARLGELEEKLTKACDDLVSGKASALAASRVATAVADLSIDPRGVERAGSISWAPAADYLALRLDRVRAAAADLREEIGPAVGLLSAAARRLEKLDAVLAEVTRETESRLLARVAPAQERRFSRALARFVPEHGGGEAEIRAGMAKGGALRGAVEAAVFATIAVFRHDRARIEGLVEAAIRTVSV